MAKKMNMAERISEMVNDEAARSWRTYTVSGGAFERYKGRK